MPATDPYDGEFFDYVNRTSGHSADEVVPVLLKLLQVSSVVDVGCGVGNWLDAFQRNGIADYLGVDGDYVDRAKLKIPAERFRAADLTQPLKIDQSFDLAICLEVGEHLPAGAAETLVESLAGLSDIVVFSAAIPNQGGVHHVNEQWPAYWADLFAARGLHCYDCIRTLLWENKNVEWWYAQNTLLYCRDSALVHPMQYETELFRLMALRDLRKIPNLPWAWKALRKSLAQSIRSRLGGGKPKS
jgi:SAM-dependent methyltransferase